MNLKLVRALCGPVIAGIVLGLILAIPIWKWTNDKEIVQMPWKAVFQSPEYTRMGLEHFMTKLKGRVDGMNIVNVKTGKKIAMSKEIDDFMVKQRLDEMFAVITNSMQLAKSNRFNLVIIPDNHADVYVDPPTQTEFSKARQGEIVNILNREKPEIVFCEGLSQGDTPQKMRESWYTMRGKYGIVSWEQIVMDPDYPVVGIEHPFCLSLVEFPMQLRDIFIRPDDKLICQALEEIGQTIRENVTLACIVETLHANGFTSAHLVMGSHHTNSLPRLCRQWGVNCKIVEN